jgi:hypothetical protein
MCLFIAHAKATVGASELLEWQCLKLTPILAAVYKSKSIKRKQSNWKGYRQGYKSETELIRIYS